MSIIRSIGYISNRIKINKEVNRLNIIEAGEEDGLPYLLNEDGVYFFTPKPKDKLFKYYKILSSETKKKIPFSHYLIACDIAIRYYGGDLKYGGPSKQLHYKVKTGDVIAEMGAFRGFYTLMLAKQVGPTGKIVAIEAMPDNYSYLKKNIEKNNLNQVICVHKGVWFEKTTLSFHRRATDMQSSSIQMGYKNEEQVQKIDVDSLYNILSENKVNAVDFMVIQLNGAELNAIRGLGQYEPKNFSIAARYNVDGEFIADEILSTLESKNYECHSLDGGFLFANKKSM